MSQESIKRAARKAGVLHGQGVFVAQIFWGLWRFPFGLLVMRSGFIPRAIGVCLIVAGVANLASSITDLFLPSWAHLISHVATILEVGELPIVLWLLFGNVNPQPVIQTA